MITRLCLITMCPTWRNLVSFWNSGYAAEVILRFVLLLLFVHADYQQTLKPHFIQPEDLWRYRYPLEDSTIPYSWLLIIVALVTFPVLGILGSGAPYRMKTERGQALLGLSLSFLLSGVIVNNVKLWIGRPRPHYLARCYGKENYFQIVDATLPCAEDVDYYGDKNKSFPSGHSSTAFSTLVYLSLYIAGKNGAFNGANPGHYAGRGWRLVVSSVPILIAAFVAGTRYADYHHHVEDIMVGALFGSLMAYLSYRLYYPSVSNKFARFPIVWLNQKSPIPNLPSSVEFIVPPNSGAMSSTSEGQLVIQDSDRFHGPDTDAPRLPSVTNTTKLYRGSSSSNINATVHLSRRPQLSSSIENLNSSDLSQPSITFFWNEGEPEVPLRTEEVETVAEELKTAALCLTRVTRSDSNNQYY